MKPPIFPLLSTVKLKYCGYCFVNIDPGGAVEMGGKEIRKKTQQSVFKMAMASGENVDSTYRNYFGSK